MDEAIVILKMMLETYRCEKRNATRKEYHIYYTGAEDAIRKAIKKLESWQE